MKAITVKKTFKAVKPFFRKPVSLSVKNIICRLLKKIKKAFDIIKVLVANLSFKGHPPITFECFG